METLLTLLERRNLCFKSFLKLCQSFLCDIEQRNLDQLDRFQHHRKSLIRVITGLETEINALAEALTKDGEFLPEARARIVALSSEKDSAARSITDIDKEIINHIHIIRAETIVKLQELQSRRKTLSAYQSPQNQIESAEGQILLDRKL